MSTNPNLFPIFNGSEKERVEKCIEYVNKTIQLRRLNPWWLLTFGMHSPQEIMERKKAFIAFPCLDLGIVGAELLVRNGISSKLIIEQRQAPHGLEVHHYMLEFQMDGNPMHIRVGRGLHLNEGAGPESQREVKMRTRTGTFIVGKATRKMVIPYTESHAHDPAYKILGFASRKFLRNSMNWTISRAARNLLAYNSRTFAKSVRRGKEEIPTSPRPRPPIGTRIATSIKKAANKFRKRK